MSINVIPISGDGGKKYDSKSPLNRMLIDELLPQMGVELAWTATLAEFLSDTLESNPIADGFTPIFSDVHDAGATYDMLSHKNFSQLSETRKSSFRNAMISGKARTTPVVALSYKHLRCTVENMSHMTIPRSQFQELYYRIFQFFQQCRCVVLNGQNETVIPTGVVLWYDRMLLAANIGTSAVAWVDRGLAPYNATIGFLNCVSRAEADFVHFDDEKAQIDVYYRCADETRIGDVLRSLWLAIEFDLAYGATTVISSRDLMVWTPVMYSIPSIDTADKELQSQVRNLLARLRSSITVSGYSLEEGQLTSTPESSESLVQLEKGGEQKPLVVLGSPRKVLIGEIEATSRQLFDDLRLCASLMSLMVGDHNFSRMPYPLDVEAMCVKWSKSLQSVLDILGQTTGNCQRKNVLIDLFAPREFDNRCKGLDHLSDSMEPKVLEYLGYFHLLHESIHWKAAYTKSLVKLLQNCDGSLSYSGRMHCMCSRHSLSPTKTLYQFHLVDIDIFRSFIYPQKAVYVVKFRSFVEPGHGPKVSVVVTGRGSVSLFSRFREILMGVESKEQLEPKISNFARELAMLLTMHGKTVRFLLEYGFSNVDVKLCHHQSDWTYAQMMDGCRAFRIPLTILLHHALNTRLVHTATCEANKHKCNGKDAIE